MRRCGRLLKVLLSLCLASVIMFAGNAPAAEKNEIIIGLLPEENIFRHMEKFSPLSAYLSEKTGIAVRFTILSKYGDVIDRFVSRNMDGAFFDAFTAVLAMEKLNVQPLVRIVTLDGSGTVRGYIFVRKDSGIASVRDMKNKRAAFVDKATATGYIFPLAYLRQNRVSNIDGFFSEYFFTGSHDSAVYAVLDGRADVGAAKSRIFDSLVAKDPLIKEELRIIAASSPLPDTILCLKKNISPEARQKIKDALLKMHTDQRGKEILRRLEAAKFISAEAADFKPVDELIGSAGITLKVYKYR